MLQPALFLVAAILAGFEALTGKSAGWAGVCALSVAFLVGVV